ncbi:hypothetical protein A3K64_02225 [Candidatus Micrarchaeota archaeon RBG_16_36_9]|nr:MAG: hypothetical protein A3K64_02225 [Candidatus Micrarchaeota archaeon RBG_16_36_9]
MSNTQEEGFIVPIEDMTEASVATKAKRAYDIADNAAREYFSLPGQKSVLDLMATVSNALTNSKEHFPTEMKEVVLQGTANNYKSKI